MKIGIIGGGIVGSTAAFYLSSDTSLSIDVYDDDWVSGTKAAVGIICPWVNQRRNKAWYQLVEKGANFYQKLQYDLKDNSFIHNSGAIVMHTTQHEKLLDIALERSKINPIMGNVSEVFRKDVQDLIPANFKFEKGIDIPGAFRVDGNILINTIRKKTPTVNWINQRVYLTSPHTINNTYYDIILISAGGMLDKVVQFDSLKYDFYPQKGILLQFPYHVNDYRILIPQGEIDFLFDSHNLVVGASHEREFDSLAFDPKVAQNLVHEATKYMPLPHFDAHRVGLRGHTSTNTPFYGPLHSHPHLYFAGGLGSSGLTSGPWIGYQLAQMILGEPIEINEQLNANKYIKGTN